MDKKMIIIRIKIKTEDFILILFCVITDKLIKETRNKLKEIDNI